MFLLFNRSVWRWRWQILFALYIVWRSHYSANGFTITLFTYELASEKFACNCCFFLVPLVSPGVTSGTRPDRSRGGTKTFATPSSDPGVTSGPCPDKSRRDTKTFATPSSDHGEKSAPRLDRSRGDTKTCPVPPSILFPYIPFVCPCVTPGHAPTESSHNSEPDFSPFSMLWFSQTLSTHYTHKTEYALIRNG